MRPGSLEFILIMAIFVVLLVMLIPGIFFLISLSKTLKAISPENRRMQPGQVWLLLIPVFNLAWIFITVGRIADSIKSECERLNIAVDESRPTYGIGLVMSILYVTGTVLYQNQAIQLIGTIFSIAGFICWILYWVKVNDYRKLILLNKDNFMFDIEKETTHPLN